MSTTANAWLKRWARRLCHHGCGRRGGHGVAQHLSHPRKGVGKAVLGPWPPAPLEAAKPDLKVGVAGCVAQAEGEEILRRAPIVDLVVGPQSYHRLPEMVAQRPAGEKVIDTDFPPKTSSISCPKPQVAPRPCRLSHHAGRLRQVLRLLRRALYARRRNLSRPVEACWPRRAGWWRRACARSRCWARTSTPITATGRPPGARRTAAPKLAKSRASRACATPPAIPATWTTT
jgi:hypothetical protein